MQHRGDAVLGDRRGVGAGQVGYRDAARGRCRNRDHVEADAVAHDGAEARRVIEQVGRELAAHHQAVGIDDEPREGGRRRVRRYDDVAVLGEHRVPGRMDRIGKQDTRLIAQEKALRLRSD